jgi:hypothetical protein
VIESEREREREREGGREREGERGGKEDFKELMLVAAIPNEDDSIQ